MSSKVNLCDESLLLDRLGYKFLEPMLKKLRGQGEALPLLNLCYLDGDDSVHHRGMQSAVREVRSASALPVTERRRVARSSHRLSRRDGSAEKGPQAQLWWATSVQKGCPHPTIAPDAVTSRTSMVRGLSPKVGSAAVGSLRIGVCTSTKGTTLLLGSGAALMA